VWVWFWDYSAKLKFFGHFTVGFLMNLFNLCERLEPRSHFISRLSMIVRVNVVLNRTVVVDND